ncbi:MAG: cyclic nucleotide-binding domain-containing protein [Acidimicrobiales bacterium]|nr:cyclic nucleotide-binding domain-containing protein [Acidimicrobiales bacterium]
MAEKLRAIGLGEVEATRLSQAGTLIDVRTDTVLCRKGERGTEGLVIVEGSAVVKLDDREVTLGPGAVIGEMATLDPFARRNATVTTTAPTGVLVYDVRTCRFLAISELRGVLVSDRAA